jgi:hypothetical protein
MDMRTLGVALALVLAAGAQAGERFAIYGDDCTSRNFNWDDHEVYVEKEIIDGGAMRSLKASVEHAPVAVTGGNPGGYSIEACKAATSPADLDAIRVTLEGGELRSTGPESRRWTVTYRIRVPHNADIDLSTSHGPLSVKDVDGTVVLRSSNGPLSLSNVSGKVDAETTNGPVSLNGGSGDVKVQSKNGPLSIDLDGASWKGGTLDASSKNGPLTVKVPRGYASGVSIESNGRGPISCRAEGCARFQEIRGRSWDDDLEPRTIELGSGPAAVHISTMNGPITVKDE